MRTDPTKLSSGLYLCAVEYVPFHNKKQSKLKVAEMSSTDGPDSILGLLRWHLDHIKMLTDDLSSAPRTIC